MYNKTYRFTRQHRILAAIMSFIMLLAVQSCQNTQQDDKTMTDSLMKNHLNALCDFDIAGINENNLGKIDEYSDSEAAKASCRLIAGKITWAIESININSSTAIAQVKIDIPTNTADICGSALTDVIIQIEQNPDINQEEIIRNAIKTHLDEIQLSSLTSEIHMSKVGNKWYISKSSDTAEIISDIRTEVAAVFAVFQSK